MRWRESMLPVRMRRIAVVVPRAALRRALVCVAETGTVDVDDTAPTDAGQGPFALRLQRAGTTPARATLSRNEVDADAAERAGDYELLAGEAQLEERTTSAVTRGDVAALLGWMPAADVPVLQDRLAAVGGTVARLPDPPGAEVPTMLSARGLRGSVAPLVRTYGTVPYADVDPTPLAWVSYLLMFGMMFGDAGHGLLLLLVAFVLRAGRPRRLASARKAWPFVAGAAGTSILFGLLYGEFFGPSHLLPVLWLAPMEAPVTLLLAGIGVGATLLAGAYAVGTVNRWREGGWSAALYAPSGLAGAALFLGFAQGAAGWYFAVVPAVVAGGVIAGSGVSLAFVGFLAGSRGGGEGVTVASVELFDLIVRLGSNIVSFARLAAFGLCHAALAAIVWDAASALWARGAGYLPLAILLFVAGTTVTFFLEALVAAVQALRLEYYELFSRLFLREGRPFRPWHLPVLPPEES